MMRWIIALGLAICAGLPQAASGADIQEEIKKIENAMPGSARAKPAKARKLLVFDLCKGFAHSSIPYCAKALQIMGRKTGAFEAVAGSDMAVFTPEGLADFDAVCFNNTTLLAFTPGQRECLMDFVKAGKGIIGIHAATDNFYDWPEAAAMMGGLFDGHPWNETVTVKVDDPGHPVNAAFKGEPFEVADEIYQFKAPYSRESLRVLLSLDIHKTDMKKGGINRKDGDFAVSWVRCLGKGRVFYCSLGHRHEIFWNPKILAHYLDGIQFALGDLPADTTPSAELKDTPETDDESALARLEELLPGIAAYEFGESRTVLHEASELIRAFSSAPATSKRAAQKMAALLEGEATYAGRQFACRQLSLIGTGGEVPLLARLLADDEMTDMARYALERIPDPAAVETLRGALGRTTGKARIGIINSLGLRRDQGAVEALGRLTDDADEETAAAALAALGRIGGLSAYKILVETKERAAGPRRLLVLDACLACAEKRIQEESNPEVASLYLQLYAPSEPRQIRIAALKGMIAAAGEKGGKVIIDVLGKGDALMRTYALEAVRTLHGYKITRDLAGGLPGLPADSQVMLLEALADRGDRAALPAIIAAAQGEDVEVRAAALAALGPLGDASCVPLLARAAASGNEAERAAAREGFRGMRDPEVNRAVLEGIAVSGGTIKAELIRAAGERGIEESVTTLLKCAKEGNEAIRLAAIRMLRKVAGQHELPELVRLVKDAGNSVERVEAAETVVTVAQRITEKDRRSGAILKVLPDVKNTDAKCALLRVLGRIGSADALPMLQGSLKHAEAEVEAAAIQSLSEWPDDAPVEDLLETAGSTERAGHRSDALRGAVRLIGLDQDRPVTATLELYRRAMDLAKEADDKKTVLAGLARVGHLEALEMARSFFREEGIQDEARTAAVRIARSICGVCPDEAGSLSAMILRTSRNESINREAQEVLDMISRFEDYITAWKVSNRYTMDDLGGPDLFDVSFPPEEDLDGYKAWRIMPAGTREDRPWLMELDRFLGGENCCAYLITRVWSLDAQPVFLEIGSDDGVKVWLNGKLIHGNNASRGCTPGEDKIQAELREGWNRLLLKVTQGGGEWSACARFRTPDGDPIDGLRFRVD